MAKSIVIYTSKRGSTRQYAEWIAEDLGCEALPLSDAKGMDLHEYDCVIYGGWIRGSGIVDFDKFARMLDDEIRPDYVIGVSAGAACGASFVAGQRGRNRRFFVDYVTDPDYMGLTAYRSSGEFFNLKYIYQDMTGKDGKAALFFEK